MKIPGFNAESSLYRAHARYRSIGNSRASLTAERSIGAAQALWGNGFDECSYCDRLSGCAKQRCYCSCSGGWVIPSGLGKCGFLCG
jgi:hypothetical protein